MQNFSFYFASAYKTFHLEHLHMKKQYNTATDNQTEIIASWSNHQLPAESYCAKCPQDRFYHSKHFSAEPKSEKQPPAKAFLHWQPTANPFWHQSDPGECRDTHNPQLLRVKLPVALNQHRRKINLIGKILIESVRNAAGITVCPEERTRGTESKGNPGLTAEIPRSSAERSFVTGIDP